jgi:hypothetical protein
MPQTTPSIMRRPVPTLSIGSFSLRSPGEGPLPTMMGYRAWFARVRAAIDLPLIGQLLYRMNVGRFIVTRMAPEHIYSDPTWLSGGRLSAKLAVTRATGARHASVRFVSGSLDRIASRESFLGLVQNAGKPTLVIYGDETPARSRGRNRVLSSVAKCSNRATAQGQTVPPGGISGRGRFCHPTVSFRGSRPIPPGCVTWLRRPSGCSLTASVGGNILSYIARASRIKRARSSSDFGINRKTSPMCALI